jgi:hypothetical protein
MHSKLSILVVADAANVEFETDGVSTPIEEAKNSRDRFACRLTSEMNCRPARVYHAGTRKRGRRTVSSISLLGHIIIAVCREDCADAGQSRPRAGSTAKPIAHAM